MLSIFRSVEKRSVR